MYEQAAGRTPLRLIADGDDAAADSIAILTLPSSGITTPQQLSGQPGGVATLPAQVIPYSATIPYNIQTLAAEEVLQNDGVSPSTVSWTQVQAKDMIGALRSGRVKAILATEPYILQAEEQLGAVEVVDASSRRDVGASAVGVLQPQLLRTAPIQRPFGRSSRHWARPSPAAPSGGWCRPFCRSSPA